MAFLVIAAGCGTIAGRQYPSLRAESSSPYYPATRIDGYIIMMGTAGLTINDSRTGEIPSRAHGLVMIPLGILDLPISLVTDTVLFPLDLARWPMEKERLSRVFDMAIGVQTTNVPGLILLDTSGRHGPNPSELPPWATFRNVSSGRIVKVVWPEAFGCADRPDKYRLDCVFCDGVRVEKLKQRPDIQQP